MPLGLVSTQALLISNSTHTRPVANVAVLPESFGGRRGCIAYVADIVTTN